MIHRSSLSGVLSNRVNRYGVGEQRVSQRPGWGNLIWIYLILFGNLMDHHHQVVSYQTDSIDTRLTKSGYLSVLIVEIRNHMMGPFYAILFRYFVYLTKQHIACHSVECNHLNKCQLIWKSHSMVNKNFIYKNLTIIQFAKIPKPHVTPTENCVKWKYEVRIQLVWTKLN